MNIFWITYAFLGAVDRKFSFFLKFKLILIYFFLRDFLFLAGVEIKIF
jgi:hypothetical protein